MTKIAFEENGFTLEQKFKGKGHKSFIYFDNVSRKKGYYYNINYLNIALIIIFGALKEAVVNKFEMLKNNDVKYDEENDIFY